jgi:hypothetical protein
VNQMLEMVKSVVLRLSILEGGQGPDPAGRGAPVPRQRVSGPPPRADTTRSVNNDFSSVCKSLYRLVQVGHHLGNWTQLPAALKKRLDKFGEDVQPPMADDQFRRKIKEASDRYSDEICRATREHLTRKQAEAELEASRLNPMDVEDARPIADKYLQSRLGSRLAKEQRDRMLDQAMGKIGTAVSIPRDVPVQLEDAQPLDQRQTVRDAQPIQHQDDQSQQHPDRVSVNKRTLKRKNMASTPEAQTRNRLDSLQSSEDESAEVNASMSDPPATWRVPAEEMEDEVVITLETPSQKPGPGCSRYRGTTTESQAKDDVSIRVPACRIAVHDGPKDNWRVKVRPGSKVLVIGDSNLKHTVPKDFPPGWEIHACAGANFRHVIRVLSDYGERVRENPPEVMLDHIIIQVGVNHRDDPMDTMREIIIRLETVAAGLARSVSIVGISVAKELDEPVRKNVDNLNKFLSQGSFNYISPLPLVDVGLRPKDPCKVHFDERTLRKVIDSMINHVNRQSLN